MAKKLINDYRIDVDSNTVYLQGNYRPERFLIITDVNTNALLYNFAGGTATGYTTWSFSEYTEETALTLATNLSSSLVTTGSKLQIFIETDNTEVYLADTFIDPVNKIRVSEPQNLIDTDFEYGLQGTKWETLELSSNIPSYYVSEADTGINTILSMASTAGSDKITVTTGDPHRLAQGTPIDVRGLSSQTAEGKYLISSTPTDYVFVYTARAIQTETKNINGTYTTVTPGQFYAGSQVPFDASIGMISDQAITSSITITTPSEHGFLTGSNFYLVNSVAPKVLELTDTTGSAADGRPYVDFVDTLAVSLTNTASFTETKQMKSSYALKFNASAVNATANTITWTAHDLHNNDCLLYSPPAGDDAIGGMQRFQVYYIVNRTTNTIQLSLTQGGSPVNFTDTGTYTKGRAQLSLCYEVVYAYKNNYSWQTEFYTPRAYNGDSTRSGWDLTDNTYYNNNFGQNLGIGRSRTQYAMYFSPNGSSMQPGLLQGAFSSAFIGGMIMNESTQSPGDYNFIEDFNRYKDNFISSYGPNIGYSYFYGDGRWYHYYANQFYSYENYYYQYFNGANGSTDRLYYIMLEEDSERDSFYIQNHGFNAGDTVTLSLNSGVLPTYSNVQQGSIYDSSARGTLPAANYTIDYLSPDRFRLVDSFNNLSYPASGNTIKIMDASGSYIFDGTATNQTADSFYIANHNLVNGDELKVTGTVPVVFTGSIVPDSSTTVGNLKQAWNIMSAYMDTYVAASGSTMRMDGYDQGTPFEDGTTGSYGATAIWYPYWNSPYMYDPQFGGYGNNWNSIGLDGVNVKDAGTNTGIANKGFSIIGTKFEQGSTINHYSFLYSNSKSSNFNEFYISRGFNWVYYPNLQTNWTQRNHGNGWYSAGYVNASTPNNGSSKGFVGFEVWLINETDWDNSYSRYNQQVYSYAYYGYTYGYMKKYIKFNCSFLLPQSRTSFDSTDFYNMLDGLVTNFTTNFIKPDLASGDTTSAVVINNNRFALNASNGTRFNLSSSGAPTLSFEITSQAYGAADGAYTVTSVPTEKSLVIKLPFKAQNRALTFNASSSVNASSSYITLTNHNLSPASPLTYAGGSGSVVYPLTSGSTYYAIIKDESTISLATSSADALANQRINISGSTNNTHILIANFVNGRIPGKGTITTTTGSYAIVGDVDTLFKRYFKIGDTVTLKDNSTTPGTLYDYTVASIADDNNMTVTNPITFEASASKYFVSTLFYARPDGATFHRPFDGGVEIQAGTAPDSQIIRQTRKYFRYQSGKGIQTSLAINFNPPRLCETINSSGLTATITNKYPHRIKVGDFIVVENSVDEAFNGTFEVQTTADDFTFTYTMTSTPTTSVPSGLVTWRVSSWSNSVLRAGMFDNQNGFFFEYDGSTLSCVRRSSTTQISGTATAVFNSNIITGTNTNFTGQLSVGDKIVLRGTTYKVTKIKSNTELIVNPQYKGVSANGIIITKTEEKRVPQTQWNLDKCDGTGPSGYNLDISKIQMAYMDYSWYGAGKIRFGFKDRDGHVIYVNQITHNNRLTEAYMRSGNLPARYEIENTGIPTYVPSLFHWGTSVIMDGKYDDDGAYKFTASSKTLTFTNGQAATGSTTGNSQITVQYNYTKRTYDWYVQIPFNTSDADKFAVGTKLFTSNGALDGNEVAYTEYGSGVFYVYIFVQDGWNYPYNAPYVASGTSVNIGTATQGTSDVKLGVDLIPLISTRLAPSVDSGLTGNLGAREIINRMQLKLKEVGLILTHDCEVFLILNGDSSNVTFENVQKPSLSQLIRHNSGDRIVGGTKVFQFRAAGGTTDSTGKRLSNTTNFSLDGLIDMGNSILGGDTTFPNGPDLITVAVGVIDTQGINSNSPFQAGSRLTWNESQA
jgi:hypothetical protein